MNDDTCRLTLDELGLVAGGSDAFSLQQALAAQQQAAQQASNASKSNHDTVMAILRKLRG
jgi:hypothetical protein